MKRKFSVFGDGIGDDEAPPRRISVFGLRIGEHEATPSKISVFGLGIGQEDEAPPSAIMSEDDFRALQELIEVRTTSKPKRNKSSERPRPNPEPKKSPGCVKFGNVEVFKFGFTQGFDTVPTDGGTISLGMDEKHHAKYTFNVDEYAQYKRNERHLKHKNCQWMEKRKEGKMEEEEEDQGGKIHQQHQFFNRFDERFRRALLANDGVQIDEIVVNETQNVLKSREQCGCRCTGGRCCPETCECIRNGIECQLDIQDEDNITNNFPCICTVEGCQNPFGRTQLDQLQIKQHHTQTIMRIKAAQKLGADWDDEKNSPQHTIFRDK